MSHPLLAVLEKACAGLIFPSETDAGLTPFLREDGRALTTERMLEIGGHEEGTPVETMELADFFLAIPKDNKPGFDALATTLRQTVPCMNHYASVNIETS